jgi:hypothetical protein
VRLQQAAPNDPLACRMRAETLPEALEGAGSIELTGGRQGAAMTPLRAGLRQAPREAGAVEAALAGYRRSLARDPGLHRAIVKTITSAARGWLWLRPQDPRRALLGESAMVP